MIISSTGDLLTGSQISIFNNSLNFFILKTEIYKIGLTLVNLEGSEAFNRQQPGT